MKRVSTTTAEIWLDEAEGILHGVFKAGAKETLTEAKENVAVAQGLAKGRKFGVLIDMSGIESISRDARNYYGGPEASSYSLGQALITRSVVGKLIANFFIGLNKTPHPVRLFNDRDDAIAWLKQLGGSRQGRLERDRPVT